MHLYCYSPKIPYICKNSSQKPITMKKSTCYLIIVLLGFLSLGLASCSNEDEPENRTSFEDIYHSTDISYLPQLKSGAETVYYKVRKSVSTSAQELTFDEMWFGNSNLQSRVNPYIAPDFFPYDQPKDILITNGIFYFVVGSELCTTQSSYWENVFVNGDLILHDLGHKLYADGGKKISFLFPAQWVDHNGLKAVTRNYPCSDTKNRHQVFDIKSCTNNDIFLVRRTLICEPNNYQNLFAWFTAENPDVLNSENLIKVENPETYYHTMMDMLTEHYGESCEFMHTTVNLVRMREAIEADLSSGPDREHWRNVLTPDEAFDNPYDFQGSYFGHAYSYFEYCF